MSVILYQSYNESKYKKYTVWGGESAPGSWTRPLGVRVLKIDGAFAPRVLKFDSGCAAEGYGSALSGTSINAAFGGI